MSTDHPRPFIPYEVPLGDGNTARLVLPADLTKAEADRICGVIQALPFATESPSAPVPPEGEEPGNVSSQTAPTGEDGGS